MTPTQMIKGGIDALTYEWPDGLNVKGGHITALGSTGVAGGPCSVVAHSESVDAAAPAQCEVFSDGETPLGHVPQNHQHREGEDECGTDHDFTGDDGFGAAPGNCFLAIEFLVSTLDGQILEKESFLEIVLQAHLILWCGLNRFNEHLNYGLLDTSGNLNICSSTMGITWQNAGSNFEN